MAFLINWNSWPPYFATQCQSLVIYQPNLCWSQRFKAIQYFLTTLLSEKEQKYEGAIHWFSNLQQLCLKMTTVRPKSKDMWALFNAFQMPIPPPSKPTRWHKSVYTGRHMRVLSITSQIHRADLTQTGTNHQDPHAHVFIEDIWEPSIGFPNGVDTSNIYNINNIYNIYILQYLQYAYMRLRAIHTPPISTLSAKLSLIANLFIFHDVRLFGQTLVRFGGVGMCVSAYCIPVQIWQEMEIFLPLL